jgi:hypothetical protein
MQEKRDISLEYNRNYVLLIPGIYSPIMSKLGTHSPQEHVWKAARNVVSHNHIEPRFAELATRFQQHLASTVFNSFFLDRYGCTTVCPMFIRFFYKKTRGKLGLLGKWVELVSNLLAWLCVTIL